MPRDRGTRLAELDVWCASDTHVAAAESKQLLCMLLVDACRHLRSSARCCFSTVWPCRPCSAPDGRLMPSGPE
eukprot:365673-Chlamydomonas_euryale.AAC.12